MLFKMTVGGLDSPTLASSSSYDHSVGSFRKSALLRPADDGKRLASLLITGTSSSSGIPGRQTSTDDLKTMDRVRIRLDGSHSTANMTTDEGFSLDIEVWLLSVTRGKGGQGAFMFIVLRQSHVSELMTICEINMPYENAGLHRLLFREDMCVPIKPWPLVGCNSSWLEILHLLAEGNAVHCRVTRFLSSETSVDTYTDVKLTTMFQSFIVKTWTATPRTTSEDTTVSGYGRAGLFAAAAAWLLLSRQTQEIDLETSHMTSVRFAAVVHPI